MPVNRHLEWAEIEDFAPGLWTASDWQMPATAAQVMDDCRPDIGGGLRAAPKASAFTTVSGLPTGSGIEFMGAFMVGGQGSTGSQSDRYLFVKNGTNLQIYNRDDTVGGSNPWSQIGSNIALGSGGINTIVCDLFVDASDVQYVIFNVFLTQSNDGVYSIQRSNHTVTKRLSGATTCVVVQDDRIIAAQGPTLRFSDSQSVSSFPAANELPVQVSRQGANIVAMRAYAPSDILLGMQFAPWVSLQGDITDPVVRSMSDARFPGGIQQLPLTSSGMVFSSPHKGIFLTGDGSDFTSIAEQIDPETWSQLDLAYATNYLISGEGLLWHEPTKSWFRASDLPSNCRVAATASSNEIMAAAYVADEPVIYTFKTDETVPASSWTWKSAPVHGPDDARQVEIREVQAYVRSFDSGSTLACTVGGVTHTENLDANTGQMVKFLFVARGEKLDVQLVATADDTGEAPTLEKVRIGTGKGHQL